MNQQNIFLRTGAIPPKSRSMEKCTRLLVFNSAGRVGWSLPDPLPFPLARPKRLAVRLLP